MNKGAVYIAIDFIAVLFVDLLIVAYQFKDQFLSINKFAYFKRNLKCLKVSKENYI